MSSNCPLCQEDGGTLIVRQDKLRLIRANEAGFPAFYRLIWNAHVAEWSDLRPSEQQQLMAALTTVEQTLRQHLQPHKINLAALGNVVPHLHWHIIARFRWDSHFPAPVWAAAERPAEPASLAALQAQIPALDQALAAALSYNHA